ncbi:hypothetical protein BYT27DRAFT_7104826 [Phlegmacium glaucopus]|nr:hypothetical protein BYT27DRAFT_7104826 [Phlegmacium glaucopus]
MNLHLPIPLFFILQLFTSIAWSQGASPTVSLIPPSTFSDATSTSSITTSTSGTQSVTTSAANATTSATATSTAQFPSLSGVSSCVSDCLAQGSARLNCTSVVDVNCFCVNSNYPAEIVTCVLANCPTEVTTIEALGQQFCNIASAHPSLSFPSLPVTPSAPSSSSIPVTTSAVTSTPTPTPTTGAAFSWKSNSIGLMGLGVLLVLGVGLGV